MCRSDPQELIPEFFYLPEMLVNANGYHLGMREDRVMVGDVDLPPWAKTPEDFVRINRMVRIRPSLACFFFSEIFKWISSLFNHK